MNNDLDDDVRFALDIIAAEEREQFTSNQMQKDIPEQLNNEENNTNKPALLEEQNHMNKNGLILIQQKDITINNQFTLQGTDELGNSISMPITGKGILDTFVMRASNKNFIVRVEIDKYNVVDDTFDNLQTITTELSHVGAFSTNSDFVVSVSSYPFEERINITIIALSGFNIDVSIARAELLMGDDFNLNNGLDPETAELLEGI